MSLVVMFYQLYSSKTKQSFLISLKKSQNNNYSKTFQADFPSCELNTIKIHSTEYESSYFVKTKLIISSQLKELMASDAKWYFTAEQLATSPSRKCGMDADQELIYRQRAANLIQDMGQRLHV